MQKRKGTVVNSRRSCKGPDSLPSSCHPISRKSCMKRESGMRSSTSNSCIYFNWRSICAFFLTRHLIRIKQNWSDVSKTSIWINSRSFESGRVKKEKITFSEGSYHGLSINWRVKIIRSYWKESLKNGVTTSLTADDSPRERMGREGCRIPSLQMKMQWSEYWDVGDIDCKNGLKRSICTLTVSEDTERNEEIDDGRRHYVWIVLTRTLESNPRKYDFF